MLALGSLPLENTHIPRYKVRSRRLVCYNDFLTNNGIGFIFSELFYNIGKRVTNKQRKIDREKAKQEAIEAAKKLAEAEAKKAAKKAAKKGEKKQKENKEK